MQKKNIIKIPKDIVVIYSDKKKMITLIGPLKTKSLVLKVKLNLIKSDSIIEVTNHTFVPASNSHTKQIKTIQGTTKALINQLLLEASATVYQKLKFVGVGYRAFSVEDFQNELLMFKLGYSHPLYFKIPNEITIFSLKFTKLFIYGNSYNDVTQISSTIRSYKKPEPYKGKGILYDTEKIILKEGKKV